jgi:DNA-binding CsgD family transcriptional regulator
VRWLTVSKADGVTVFQSPAVETSPARPLLLQLLKRFNLTRREMEATIYLAEGLDAKQIAQQMSCSEKTVYAHLSRVSRKASCRDYQEVICVLLASACHIIMNSLSDLRTGPYLKS